MMEDKIALTREIGERLRYAGETAGINHGQRSEPTGGVLSKSRIGNYEQGMRRPSIEVARRLTWALGNVSPAFPLCIDDATTLTADELKLLRTHRATDPYGQVLVRKKAETEAKRTAKAGRLDQRVQDGRPVPAR